MQPPAKDRGTSKSGRGKAWGGSHGPSKGGKQSFYGSGKNRISGGNIKKKAHVGKSGTRKASGSSNQHRNAASRSAGGGSGGGGGGIGMMPLY